MIAGSGVPRVWAHNVVVRETGDPEVVVGEYDYDGRVTTTGRTFLADATGHLADLLSALDNQQSESGSR
jgi:hypothetical protein